MAGEPGAGAPPTGSAPRRALWGRKLLLHPMHLGHEGNLSLGHALCIVLKSAVARAKAACMDNCMVASTAAGQHACEKTPQARKPSASP